MTEEEFDDVRSEIGAEATISLLAFAPDDPLPAIVSQVDESDSFLLGGALGKTALTARIKKSDAEAAAVDSVKKLVGTLCAFQETKYRIAAARAHPASAIIHLTLNEP